MAEKQNDNTQEIIDGIGIVMADAIEKLGDKLKQPTTAEARKQKQEELLAKRAAQNRLNEAKLAHADREDRIAKCRAGGHAKFDAKKGTAHAFRGNLNFDGCIRAQCISCHLQLPPFKAPDSIKQGSSVNEWFERLPNLTEDILIKWSHETNPEWWAAEDKKAVERKEFRDAFNAETVAVGA